MVGSQRRVLRCGSRPLPRFWAAALFGMLCALAPARGQSLADAAPPAAADPLAEARRLERAFERIAQRVSPSVVALRSHRAYPLIEPDAGADSQDESLLEPLIVVHGAGTVISRQGHILTNEHVVHAAARIEVFFYDGTREDATLIGADPRSDLAVLQVRRRDLPPATMCRPGSVRRGQWAVAVGNPYGLGNDGSLSVSVGVISNLNRVLPGLGEDDDRFYYDMMQTTAQINPGNSGGPLFNLRGELIGVVTAMHTRAGVDEGVGFAIPLSETRRRIIERLRSGQTIEYGYIGLTVRCAEPQERQAAGAPDGPGVCVLDVDPEGPAQRAGLRVGDIITRCDGVPVRSAAEMAHYIGLAPVGSRVRIEYIRAGRVRTVLVPLARRESCHVRRLRRGN